MKSDVFKFFAVQRQIFGVCPHCANFFRLSDCRIFQYKKPAPDWLERIILEERRLQGIEDKLNEKETQLREKARERGRKLAVKAVRKIDSVFSPRKLNPDDAKVIFHPIDYVVFNGMKGKVAIKNIVLLDRKAGNANRRALQKSIERAVEREKYEWQTLRVQEDGKIKTEF